ncbi:MAG: response regulator [Verrucomicrobiota bacterium]
MSEPQTPAKTVLIADDDETTVMFLEATARKLGHETIGVSNGKEVIEQANVHRPDLILLDLLMPDIDGYTDLRILRSNWRTREIPIIVISGYAEQKTAQKCLTAGANHYLHKPVTFDQVREAINRFLPPEIPAKT